METGDNSNGGGSYSQMSDIFEKRHNNNEKEQDSDFSKSSESSDGFNYSDSDFNELESEESESSGGFEYDDDSTSVIPKEEAKSHLNESDVNDFLNQLKTSTKSIFNTYEIYNRYGELPKKLPSNTKLTPIEEVLLQPCCIEMCCLKFTPEFVMRARLKIPTSKPENVHYFQFFLIQSCTNIDGIFSPKVNEIPICDEFFRRIYAIPKTRFDSFEEQISKGYSEPLPHGNKNRSSEHASTSLRVVEILRKMDDLVEPNPADSSYLMATGTTQTDVIKLCNLNTKIKINPTQEFKRIGTKFRWHKTHSHKRCRICTLLKEAKNDPANSVAVQKEAELHLENHCKNYANDNRDYFLRKIESNEQPKLLLSLAHDGMSKEKTKFPHLLKSNTKKLSDAMKMMCSLNLGLVHRKTPETSYQLHCFWNVDQMFGGGANSIISQLFFTISHCDPIPPNISIQLDNCASNKCYTLFGAFGLLLLWIKQLTHIYICTSEVGHTHNDVDQKFSILATPLKKDQVYTPQGYTRYAKEKLKGLITNNLFPTTYDFDSFIRENVIENGLISKNHYLELTKLEDNTVTMKIARFLRSEKFLSTSTSTQSAAKLFKEPPNVELFPAIITPKKIDTEKHKKLCQVLNGSIPEEDYQELLKLPQYIDENYMPEPLKDVLDRITSKMVAQDIDVSVPEDTENENIEKFLKKIEKPWDRKPPESPKTSDVEKPSTTPTRKRHSKTQDSKKTSAKNLSKRKKK